MKAIFAICLLLAFSCAQSTFTPQWTSCEKQDSGWATQNVTLDVAPVAGKNSTFTLCGEVHGWYVVHFSQVHVTSETGLDLTIPLENVNIYDDKTGCYDVNFQIPEGQKDLTINFATQFIGIKKLGCVDVTLNLERFNNKFLAF